MTRREQTGYCFNDNKLGLRDGEDYTMVNQQMWNMFQDRYGCDHIIQLRKYESFEQMLPTNYDQSAYYASFDAKQETWFCEELEAFRLLNERDQRI